jgi:hypothetical protein
MIRLRWPNLGKRFQPPIRPPRLRLHRPGSQCVASGPYGVSGPLQRRSDLSADAAKRAGRENSRCGPAVTASGRDRRHRDAFAGRSGRRTSRGSDARRRGDLAARAFSHWRGSRKGPIFDRSEGAEATAGAESVVRRPQAAISAYPGASSGSYARAAPGRAGIGGGGSRGYSGNTGPGSPILAPDEVASWQSSNPAYPELRELSGTSGAQRFHDAIAAAKAAHPDGPAVTLYSPEEYAGMRPPKLHLWPNKCQRNRCGA